MLQEDSHILKNLYDRVIINEISQKFVDEVKSFVSNRELSFNEIFGDKLRIIIPIGSVAIYKEILNKITQIPNYDTFDKNTKEVVKKIKLDPKYGGGEKEQRINLGKAVASLRIPEEEKKKYLNWYAKYGQNISEMDDLSIYSIILSRSPIDVLRMGEVGNTGHCHQQGNSFFKCAIQEAKTGGPIAYLIKTIEINKISSDEEFQNEEIFQDDSRGVKGIKALGRLRIRKYFDEEDIQDLGLPESKIYGKNVAGFYDTVRDFFLDKQNLNVSEILKKYENGNIIKSGGSYDDTSDNIIFNKMFGVTSFSGRNIKHEENEENEVDYSGTENDRYHGMEEELEHINNQYNQNYKHLDVGYQMDEDSEDDYPQYRVYGYIRISIDFPITEDFEEIGGDTLNNVKNYKSGQRLPWGYSDSDINRIYKFQKFLTTWKTYCPNDFVKEYLGSCELALNFDKKITKFRFSFRFKDTANGYDMDSSGDVDDYRHFLREISEFDDEYDEIRSSLIKALKVSGYILSDNSEKYNNLVDAEDFERSLSNFELDSDDFNIYTNLTVARLDKSSMENIPKGIRNSSGMISMISDTVFEDLAFVYSTFILKYLNAYYKTSPKKDEEQPSFKKFFESSEYKSLDLANKFGIENIKVVINVEKLSYGDAYGASANIEIHYDILTQELSEVLKFLDDNIKDLKNAMTLIVAKVLNIKNQYIENLNRVYGKLVWVR